MTARTCPTDGVSTVPLDFADGAGKGARPGEIFSGRYKIVRLLGQGGYGRVHEAIQLSVKRPVAVKTLYSSRLVERQHLLRFYREARAASALKGPHVTRIYDFGIDEDTAIPFIVMELLEGRDLSDLISIHAPLPVGRALALLKQTALALLEAAENGIVHRDVKPSNIFIVKAPGHREMVKVMDFGIAKVVSGEESSKESLTAEGMSIGTAHYMAPEQALGEHVDERTDLYALGCILHEMLTGNPPFPGERLAVLMAHVHNLRPTLEDPLPVGESLPPALATLHARLLAKDRNERPPNARVVVEIIEAIEDGDNIDVAHAIAAAYSKRYRRKPTVPPTEVARLYPLDRGNTPSSRDPEEAALPLTTDRDSNAGALALQAELGEEAPPPPLQAPPAPEAEEPPEGVEHSEPPDFVDVFDSSAYRKKPVYQRRPWFLLGLLIAAAVIALAWPDSGREVAEEPGGEAGTKAAPVAAPEPKKRAPAPAAPAAPVAAPSRPAPAHEEPSPTAYARLVLSTEPPGTRVLRDGELLCISPCDVSVPAGDDAEVLVLHRKGFPEREVEIFLGADLTVRRLIRLAAQSPPPPREPAAKRAKASKRRLPAKPPPPKIRKAKRPLPEGPESTPKRSLPAFRGRLTPGTE